MFHLKPKPSPSADVGLGDAGPRRRLLGDRGDAGDPLVDGGVHLLEELHGLEVLAAAVDVGRPLAVLAGVVEVEHRGDAVDPQPVGVELLEPVDGVGEEEVAHLAAAEVEDVRAPLLVPPALRVGVLVERRAVEAGQRPLVGREVAGHPVEDDADAGLVQPVDEEPEVVGVAEARVRREVRRHVVAPRAAERVLHHRHQLDVGEAQPGDVRRQLVGQLGPGPVAAVGCFFHDAEVHLVDAHRLVDGGARRRARRASRRRPTRRTTRRPSRRCRRASRPRQPSGRPSRATRRRGRGSRTCTPRRRRRRARTAPRRRRCRAAASGARGRPSC